MEGIILILCDSPSQEKDFVSWDYDIIGPHKGAAVKIVKKLIFVLNAPYPHETRFKQIFNSRICLTFQASVLYADSNKILGEKIKIGLGQSRPTWRNYFGETIHCFIFRIEKINLTT